MSILSAAEVAAIRKRLFVLAQSGNERAAVWDLVQEAMLPARHDHQGATNAGIPGAGEVGWRIGFEAGFHAGADWRESDLAALLDHAEALTGLLREAREYAGNSIPVKPVTMGERWYERRDAVLARIDAALGEGGQG
jgi:hypothetical protein